MRRSFLVTGANGFLGLSLCAELLRQEQTVFASTRSDKIIFKGMHVFATGNIDAHTDWSCALHGIDVVIHLAARVHVMQDDATNPLEEFRKVNVQGTENLARQAAKVG